MGPSADGGAGSGGGRGDPVSPSPEARSREVPPEGIRRLLVRLSAALAGEDGEELEGSLDRLTEMERYHGQVEEVLLQAYLFLGFPAVLDAFRAWRERVPAPGPSGRSCGEGAGREPAESEDLSQWSRRGQRMCRRVYGSAYAGLRRNVATLHPDLDRWMIQEGYGKVLSRPGLDPGTRETCIVAVLAATGREPQLHSHLRGALRVGAAPSEVDDALERGLRHTRHGTGDPDWPDRARRLWRRIRLEREG